ncbi:hypothetical protein BKA70DRAFT_1250018 [Coprinopsis sp. MPI-PUGE-AT-0042]|nr:hypothetical protein BKA70DRAFT_1349581 [Coprinopsis sp. MPI-PUGE-AT-0042]KAH6916602.1 hypothetical protein BKA70DRAFT_1250018 [Coprinopsis sp. MPI-PUGE-AT-0042]
MYSSSDSSDDERYFCSRCGSLFTSSWDLNNHRSQHDYRCDACRRDFVDRQALHQHLSNSSFHNYCEWCRQDYSNPQERHAHMRSEHEECTICQLYFVSYEMLKVHYRDSSNHLYCFDCNRHFDNPDNLKHHLASGVHQERDVECLDPQCNRRFISLAALMAHYDSEGAGCQIVNRVRLYDAVRVFDQSSFVYARQYRDASFHCPGCNKQFALLSGVCNHIAGGTCSDYSGKEQMENRIWEILRSAVAWLCN